MDSIKLESVTCGIHHIINKLHNTYYLSAALLFGKSSFIKEVPYDPTLIYSYQTVEQQFYAIRLFTHGWNLYVPTQHILATNYEKTLYYDVNNNRIFAPSNVNKGKSVWKRVLYYYGLCSIEELEDDMKKDISLLSMAQEITQCCAIHDFCRKIEAINFYDKQDYDDLRKILQSILSKGNTKWQF